MKYSLSNNLLLETTTYSLRPPSRAGMDSLQQLCAQFVTSTTDTQKGNIGEAIALIVLGLERGSVDFTTAQTSALNTNKWNSGFPFVDIMSRPLDENSSSADALNSVFWSVKTNNSTQNWNSLVRLANFPHWTGRGMQPIGLRDLFTPVNSRMAPTSDPPRTMTLSIGYVHVGSEGNTVIIRIFEPEEITFTRQNETIEQVLGERIRIRGERLTNFCRNNPYYAPPRNIGPGTTARRFWRRQQRPASSSTIVINVPAQVIREIQATMIPPAHTRRSLAQNLARQGNRTRLPRGASQNAARQLGRMAGMPNREFYQAFEGSRGRELEILFRAFEQRYTRRFGERIAALPPQQRNSPTFRSPPLGLERRNPPVSDEDLASQSRTTGRRGRRRSRS